MSGFNVFWLPVKAKFAMLACNTNATETRMLNSREIWNSGGGQVSRFEFQFIEARYSPNSCHYTIIRITTISTVWIPFIKIPDDRNERKCLKFRADEINCQISRTISMLVWSYNNWRNTNPRTDGDKARYFFQPRCVRLELRRCHVQFTVASV